MPLTPNSQGSSYLSAAEFLKRKDARTVGQLCSDTDVPIPAASLPANANLLSALDDSSGLIEAAILRGQRYQPADLAALTGVGQKFLFRLLADLTMGLLYERRADLGLNPPESVERAFATLQELADGHEVLSLQEAQAAGKMQHHVETEADVLARNGIVVIADRYFGRRGNRLPTLGTSPSA